MIRYALVVIDMQPFFFRNETRKAALSNLFEKNNELLQFAHDNKIPIIKVKTVHNPDKSTWNLVMKKYDKGGLYEGDTNVELYEEILKFPEEETIIKTRQSTFIRTNFEELLNSLNIETLILTGVFIHGCVGRTAVDAYERDFHVILAKEASFSDIPLQEQAMIDVITGEQEQQVLTNNEIINVLSKELL